MFDGPSPPAASGRPPATWRIGIAFPLAGPLDRSLGRQVAGSSGEGSAGNQGSWFRSDRRIGAKSVPNPGEPGRTQRTTAHGQLSAKSVPWRARPRRGVGSITGFSMATVGELKPITALSGAPQGGASRAVDLVPTERAGRVLAHVHASALAGLRCVERSRFARVRRSRRLLEAPRLASREMSPAITCCRFGASMPSISTNLRPEARGMSTGRRP
jgi:hypothetical protein